MVRERGRQRVVARHRRPSGPVEPLQKRLFGGCRLTRSIDHLVARAGFTVHDLAVFDEDGPPKILGADCLGPAGTPRVT
jgi:hypothetical protein